MDTFLCQLFIKFYEIIKHSEEYYYEILCFPSQSVGKVI